jgi:hypothetical protein
MFDTALVTVRGDAIKMINPSIRYFQSASSETADTVTFYFASLRTVQETFCVTCV